MEKNKLDCRRISNSLLRGGGCMTSIQNIVQPPIKYMYNPNVFDQFKKFNYFVQVIESKASVAANIQESAEIMIAIQWFIFQEENIYQLNKHFLSVQKSYDQILDGIKRLLKSCLIYIRTDSFKCLYILQITASLSKIIFSFHLTNNQRFLKFETQTQFLEICEELSQQIEIEKNDLIHNQIELFLLLTQTSIEITPIDCREKNEILKGCLKGIINSLISLTPDIQLLESLFEGACLLNKKYNIPKKRRQYEAYYQIDIFQWEIILYFKEDKGKSIEEIIQLIEYMYENLVKSSKNWNYHYLWIQMIGKILIYNPLIKKQCLSQIIKSSNFFNAKSLNQIWNDYKNQGLLIEMNYDTDQAIILLDCLQSKKAKQLNILFFENYFKKWENLMQLKDFLMNELSSNKRFTFRAYLKGKLDLGENEKDNNILTLNKMKKILDFILSKKLLLLIQNTHENLKQIKKIQRNFGIHQQISIKIQQK